MTDTADREGAVNKVLQYEAAGRPVWKDAPMPKPGPDQVLVKVLGVATCPHWDIHIMDGVQMLAGMPLEYPYPPGQPGHEAMGEVVEVGRDVEHLTPGTRVAAWQDQGQHRPGCYGRHAVLDAGNVLVVPEHLSSEQIASLELAMCVQVSFDRLMQLDGVAGRRFAVSGLGPAGLVAVQMARAYGAREVVGLDPLPSRRELALGLGADAAFAPDASGIPSGRSGDRSLDAALDCTGLKPSIEFLMARTRYVVSIFGVLRETVEFGPDNWYGDFALLGYGRHNRPAAERALDLVVQGQLDLAALVTHRLPLSRYPEGVELLRSREAIKVCFDPWG